MPRFKGSGNLLESLQSDYDEQAQVGLREQSMALREQSMQQHGEVQEQSLAIRQQQEARQEQEMSFREDHLRAASEIAQKAAEVHDAEISARLAQEQANLTARQVQTERQQMQFSQEQGAWSELGKLNPQSPDYREKFAAVGQKYPAAFARAQNDQESGLAQFSSSMNQEHEAWAKTQIKEAQPTTVPANVAIDYAKYIGTQHEQTAILGKSEATDQEKADAQGKIVAAKSFQSEMERLYPALKPVTPGAPVTTATPAQPTDMKALAQQALSDPAASPEHKAAAQKYLSGQQ